MKTGCINAGASGEVLRPKFSIMDPELTYTLPAYQTACGAVDIMTHVFERYFTNTKDVEITDRLCEAVLITVINETPRALNNPSDYGSRSNIMWAAMLAHNNICGVGRVQDWASHALEHELSALYDVAHGAGLAVIVPAWMKYVMNENIERFAQAAVRIWGCRMNFERPEETAVKGIEMVENFFRSIGMPVSFSELGADEKDIPVLVKNLRVDSEQRIGRF